MGRVLGLSIKAEFVDERSRPIDVDRVFHVDAFVTVFGAILGARCKPTGTYIGSAVGIEEGGGSGITAIVA